MNRVGEGSAVLGLGFALGLARDRPEGKMNGVGVVVVGEVESLSLSWEFWGTEEEVDAGTERGNEEDEGCIESCW